MKFHTIALLIIVALSMTSGVCETSGQAREPRIQRGVMKFTKPVRLLDVVLKGEYLFLHHQGMMERGKPCVFVYRHDQSSSGGFVIAFHCRPIERQRAEQFTVAFSRTDAVALPIIEEIQFARSTEGHVVHNWFLLKRPARESEAPTNLRQPYCGLPILSATIP